MQFATGVKVLEPKKHSAIKRHIGSCSEGRVEKYVPHAQVWIAVLQKGGTNNPKSTGDPAPFSVTFSHSKKLEKTLLLYHVRLLLNFSRVFFFTKLTTSETRLDTLEFRKL